MLSKWFTIRSLQVFSITKKLKLSQTLQKIKQKRRLIFDFISKTVLLLNCVIYSARVEAFETNLACSNIEINSVRISFVYRKTLQIPYAYKRERNHKNPTLELKVVFGKRVFP